MKWPELEACFATFIYPLLCLLHYSVFMVIVEAKPWWLNSIKYIVLARQSPFSSTLRWLYINQWSYPVPSLGGHVNFIWDINFNNIRFSVWEIGLNHQNWYSTANSIAKLYALLPSILTTLYRHNHGEHNSKLQCIKRLTNPILKIMQTIIPIDDHGVFSCKSFVKFSAYLLVQWHSSNLGKMLCDIIYKTLRGGR